MAPTTLISSPGTSIATELSAIVLSRNPLSILFGLARIRELIEDFADGLLSGIEKSYYLESATKFIELIELYEKYQFYAIMGAALQGSGELSAHKKLLDAYFEESYYRDVDFYFFVLEKDPILQSLFDRLSQYYAGETVSLDAPVSLLYTTLCSEIDTMRGDDSLSKSSSYQANPRKLARDLYLSMIAGGDPRKIIFWRENFIESASLRARLLNVFSTEQVMDCFAFLRKKLLRVPKYNLALSDTSIYRVFIDRANTIESASVEDKIDYIADMHQAMGSNSLRRENFTNILRKGLAFMGSNDLVDAILGVAFLKRAPFFEVKRRVMTVDFAGYDFASLREVTGLISLLESSIILRFFRPFFIARLARVFTQEQTDLYHFIKFILTIHHPQTYGEYLQISKFFLGLESFSQKGIAGVFLRMVQYGWLVVALIVLFAFAPFGVTIAVFGYIALRLITKAISRVAPQLALVSNFQLTPYLALFGAISLSFALTFGMRDNITIVYSNYRTAINAVTLITSETLSNITMPMSKASLLETGARDPNAPINKLEQVDYLKGTLYRDILK